MVHTSVKGIGERTGNVATEEVALALQHLFDIDCGIDLSKLANISEIVSEISKVERARNKPVGGSGIFEVESGIIVHVIENLAKSELRSQRRDGNPAEGARSGGCAAVRDRGPVIPDIESRALR